MTTEVLFDLSIKREKGWLYYVDGNGNVVRTKMRGNIMRCYDCLRECPENERTEWHIGLNIIGLKHIQVPRCPKCYNKLIGKLK